MPSNGYMINLQEQSFGTEKRKSDNILVIFNQRERNLFFPDDLRAELGKLVPYSEWIESPLDPEEWLQVLEEKNPEIIIGAWSLPVITEEALARCSNLRYICFLTGSFRYQIPREYFTRGGILSNWGEAAAPMVAECALALTLACLRQINRFALEMHVDKSWVRPGVPHARSLFNRTVGIHGFGAVARHLLPLLRPFNVQIEAWSDPVPPAVFEAHSVKQAESLDALFANNDVIIEVEALTPLTRGSVNAHRINLMRPGTVFVNVGRGAIADQAALVKRAQQGDILLGLDVYEEEPLPIGSSLRGMRNVVLLPHTGGPTLDNYPLITRNALNNLYAYLNGETPPNVKRLEDYDHST